MREVIDDVACTVCGCVCDDLKITVEDGRIIEAQGACQLAEPWFLEQDTRRPPSAEIDGQAVSFSAAVNRAAEILRDAQNPLVFGLSRSSTDGQRAACRLADALGANIDTTASMCHAPSIMAIQAVGESTCSLGEIRNRADLVIFWGVDPVRSHPRHFERYSVDPIGRFIPNGRSDRTVVVVDVRRTETAEQADLFVPIAPGKDFEAIWALRSLIQGLPIDQELDLGVPLEVLEALAERMRNCRCGVVFFGLGLTRQTSLSERAFDDDLSEEESPLEPRAFDDDLSEEESPLKPRALSADRTERAHSEEGRAESGLGHLNVEALLRLVADLNAHTRFHARRMRIPGDVTGADSVLCWQTGYPFSVNLSRGYPRFNPGEYSANNLLERCEVDACLLVGTEGVPSMSPAAIAHLKRIPTIALDHPTIESTIAPQVGFTTAVYGIHLTGTAYRMDEVPIQLRSVLTSPYASDADVLQQIQQRI